ncbi:hypothetical protein [Burkholderia ubonensis]|uniref:hypothetical protein n=1 Tax=Burkholderia ubonensis TaxID=101571 RepID=UPI0007591E56|nr:hypothetical protein [Burkholderia ubonensis]KVP75203.1 hypothetical protein WJ93_07245 [Burkholderia ubonensis]KVP96673.1 hypothetical protein WJ97_12380 [Burkholderia ubonensis]
MKPYTRNDDKGRTRAGDDIHHRTADIPRAGAKKVAKSARHAARQEGRDVIVRALRDEDTGSTR